MSLIFDVRDHVAYLTINRPEVLNAMDPETYQALSQAWIEVRDNPDIWVAIITGAGDRSFSVGADLRRTIPRRPELWELWLTQADPILNRGLEVWKPIIAAVNGYCLGGGLTLLFATDIRIAAEHATFGLPEVKRGFPAGNGGTQRALRNLPYAVAMEMLLTGDPISAQDALRYGLVNRVVPLPELMPTAEAYARRLCEIPPVALRGVKELAIRSQYMHINDGLRLEAALSHILRQSEDSQEAVRAFAEKRKPSFQGR